MQSDYLVLIPLLLQMLGLLFAVIIDPYIKKNDRRIMLIIIGLVFVLTVQNVAEYLIDSQYVNPQLRTIVAICGYCIRPVILLLFFYIVGGARRYALLWIMVGINTAVYMSALFCGISFRIAEGNHFVRGPLGYTCYWVSAILLICLVYLTYRQWNAIRKAESFIPAVNALLIIASVAMEAFVDSNLHIVSYLTMAVVSGTLFYYIWLHLRFVREHERALMAEQRIQIMMTQIQPHFLYNTLSTIQALCKADPQKAFVITERFGTYLRQNLDSLSQPNLIPFEKELEHTRIYAQIECVRFDNISVLYDTPETGFQVPALTVQPLVENAIRHGVRVREQGIVKVATAKTDGGFLICIEDNGVGFNTSLAEKSGGSHIGLKNVRERIASMCGGSVSVESREGEGTKITILIPK